MKKVLFGAIALLLVAATSQAQSTVWKTEPNGSHSNVGFAVDHLVISETTGEFEDYEVTVKADKDDFTDAVFEVVIKTASINTKDEKRDGHLKSADFFNVEQHGTITFKGSKFKKVKGDKYKVTGELTMNGVTKTVTLDAQFRGVVKDPWGNTRAGLKVYGPIDRTDFGLKYNSALDNGGLMIGEEVRITCNVELIKQS